MQSSNIRYLPQVDHWRAVAAIWIVLYHGLHVVGGLLTSHSALDTYFVSSNPVMASLIEGHSAVSLFMVLSGFIFTYGAFGRSVSYVPFLKNRVLRIYPLFLVTVFIAMASNPGKVSLDKFLFTILPLADYSQLDAGPFVSMAWAVAVEFQFYLIFPFLLGFLNRSPAKVICGVIACALIFRLMSVELGASARDLSYWHIVGRIDQFMLGMAAAVFLKQGRRRTSHYRVLLLVGILLGMATLFWFHRLGGRSADGIWRVFWPTMEGGAYAFLIVGSVGAGTLATGAVSRCLGWLGERSFSIYLLHMPIIQILVQKQWVLKATGDTALDAMITTSVLALPITVGLAALTYSVIESPFLALRVKYLSDTSTAKVRAIGSA